MSKAQISVWKDGEKGADTAKWYNPVSVNGNHYVFKWSVADFGNYIGKYKTNIHAWDSSNNKKMYDHANDNKFIYTPVVVNKDTIAPSIVVNKDTIAPTISKSMTIASTSEKATIECSVTDNVKVKQVRLAVWKANQSSTTYKWVDAKSVNGSKYVFEINRKDFDNYQGEYNANIHAWDTSDNKRMSETPIVFTICQSTTSTPTGKYESIESISSNQIHVKGWAFDKDTLDKSVKIAVYIGGQCNVAGVERHDITANITRDDVNKAYSCGNKHGFDATITTNKTGVQEVYVWAHNTDSSDINTCLGSMKVNIHDHNHTKTNPSPSCTETLTGTDKCSICGKVHSTWTVDPAGHKYDAGVITKAETCTEDGIETYTCEVCGKTKTEIIPMTGHTIVTDKAIEPTYTTDGLTEGSHCSVCGEIIQKQEVVPMLKSETNTVKDKASNDSSGTETLETVSVDKNAEAGSNIDENKVDNTDVDDTKDNGTGDTGSETYDDEDDEVVTFKASGAAYYITGNNEVTYLYPGNHGIKSTIIPDTVKYNNVTYRVTSVSDDAFESCAKLKKVTIGKNITKIGKNAFNGCKNLKTITIKTTKFNKKSFGKNAFKGINKKATIKVPKKQLKNYKRWIKQAGVPNTVKVKK